MHEYEDSNGAIDRINPPSADHFKKIELLRHADKIRCGVDSDEFTRVINEKLNSPFTGYTVENGFCFDTGLIVPAEWFKVREIIQHRLKTAGWEVLSINTRESHLERTIWVSVRPLNPGKKKEGILNTILEFFNK